MNALIPTTAGAEALATSIRVPVVSDSDVQAAIRTILYWIGEDPDRHGLQETPSRMVKAFGEFFSGYGQDPRGILTKELEEPNGNDEMVIVRHITFQSHCEHHFAPIVGRVWVAYVLGRWVVGKSNLARLVDAYANRLQIQERMTAQIANTIESVLQPHGVGVVVEATHHCVAARGVKKKHAAHVTRRMLGCFRDNASTRQEFLSVVNADRQ